MSYFGKAARTRRKGIFTGMFFSSCHTQGRVSFLVCLFPDANRAASRRVDNANAGQGELVPGGISQATRRLPRHRDVDGGRKLIRHLENEGGTWRRNPAHL